MEKLEGINSHYVRKATDADGPLVQPIVYAALIAYGLEPDPQGVDKDLAAPYTSYEAANQGIFWVVVDASNESVVGSFALHCDLSSSSSPPHASCSGSGVAELRKMYLAESARGKGVGRACLMYAIAQARQMKCSKLMLETASVLKEAIQMYTSAGFKRVACHAEVLRCDVVMELDLSS
jgi:putative acetyltransferase